MSARRKYLALAVIAVTLIALSGCASQISTALDISDAKPVTITTSEIPRAERIVALANGSAEIISALGFKAHLVGRDIASTDKDLISVPIVTSGHQVISEKIISLNPDLVLIDKSTGPQNALVALRSAGITVVAIPEAWTLADIPVKVTAIAEAIGAPAGGKELNSAMAAVTAPLAKLTSKTRMAFLYLRGGSAIYLIGGKGSGADSLISAIGAVDVGAQQLQNPFNALTSEEMIALNPQVILVMTKGLASTGGLSGLITLPGVAQTDAGKSKRIISVDDSLLLSFGPRTPNLLLQLQSALEKVVKQ
jgi:iron complex transport system substrate-binding protein